MKTAFLYPGLNGLLRRTDRKRFLALPRVRESLEFATQTLDKRFDRNFDFLEFLEEPTEVVYHVDNVNLAAVAICAIQVGISSHLEEKLGAPAWVMGCSLGDLARSVYAGAYSFEDAIVNHLNFTSEIGGIDQIGKNIGVAASRGEVFTEADFAEFEQLQVDVSVLTPKFLNIGGLFSDLEKVEEIAKVRGWRCIDILQYPAHSRYIKPYVDKVADQFSEVRLSSPRVPMYSSFSDQELIEASTIRDEFLLSITMTIHWHKAIESLVHHHGVERFINVGPCRSLILMMRDLELDIPCLDAELAL